MSVEDIKIWSAANRLKLNDDKSEIIHISSQFRNSVPIETFSIGNSQLEVADQVRDLGVIIDQNLTLQKHIQKVCKSASWGVCNIGKIRRLLYQPTSAKLVHAFISSHLDYCNALFVGLPKITPSSTSVFIRLLVW